MSPLPWVVVDRAECADGVLELRRRGPGDFLILIDGRVLMNSRANRSERALAERGLRHLAGAGGAAVLIGGLGMGCTLRVALDILGADARVVVAEINPVVVRWCRGVLASLTAGAVNDARVTVVEEDVACTVARAAAVRGEKDRFDAVLFDLYEGPRIDRRDDPLYGDAALRRVRAALRRDGVFAVWAEQPCPPFARRLTRAGFAVELTRPGRGGLRHAVYVARPRAG
jgi:spermidine synthase